MAEVFSDISGHLHQVPIEELYRWGFIQGYSDETFRPDAPINRAELLKILVEAKSWSDEGEGIRQNYIAEGHSTIQFSDVLTDQWYSKYIAYAYANGIVSGYPDGRFLPGNNVLVSEALKIVLESYFDTISDVSGEWYQKYYDYAVVHDYLSSDAYDPAAQMTRGQVANLIYRIEVEFPSQTADATNEATFQTFLSNAITSDQKIEKINFAMNEAGTSLDPEWKTHAQDMIDQVNKVFFLNTDKQFEVVQFLTYPDVDRCAVQEDDDYFYSNGSYGGITIFYTLFESEDYTQLDPDTCPLGGAFTGVHINDLTQQSFGKILASYEWNEGAYAWFEHPNTLLSFVHEMGHTYGLGRPEWYKFLTGFNIYYRYQDKTGVSPDLGVYDPPYLPPLASLDADNDYETLIDGSSYRVDAMFGLTQDLEFSALNAFVIDHNANHQFSVGTISSFVSDGVFIQVFDVGGVVIKNATVQVYGVSPNCAAWCYDTDYDQFIIETATTDENGLVRILPTSTTSSYSSDGSPEYGVKMVKVYQNDLEGGAYFSSLDLWNTKILNQEDIFILPITLK